MGVAEDISANLIEFASSIIVYEKRRAVLDATFARLDRSVAEVTVESYSKAV